MSVNEHEHIKKVKKKKHHSTHHSLSVADFFKSLYLAMRGLFNITFAFCIEKFRKTIHYFDLPEFEDQNIYPTFKALNTKPSRAYVFLYFTLISMLTAFLIWAAFFEVDAFVNAKGEVETFSKVNTISSPESNVIEKIHVAEGQTVKAGELLVTFDKATQLANNASIEKQYFANQANLERLDAQQDDIDLVLSQAVKDYSADIANNTMDRYKSEISSFKDGQNIADQKISQKKSEIQKIKEQISIYQEKAKIIQDELSSLQKLATQQLITRTRLLESEKELADNKIKLEGFLSDLPRAESELNELISTKSQFINNYKRQVNFDLDQARTLQTQLKAEYASASQKLNRSSIVSPIDGIIYKIPNTTTSSTITAGQEIISLVPIEDSLIVSANVRPEDIGLIHIGEDASVKITTYDYAIYGLLKGKVTQMSPETFVNPVDNKPYFIVKIKTDKNYLTHHDRKFYISPGMVAMVDIMVDKRTVLQYITNPFIKTIRESLNEK
jgi:adhesin transport system membrane fusion protein